LKHNIGIGKILGEPSAINTELCPDWYTNSKPVTVMIDWLQRTLVITYITSYWLQQEKQAGS